MSKSLSNVWYVLYDGKLNIFLSNKMRFEDSTSTCYGYFLTCYDILYTKQLIDLSTVSGRSVNKDNNWLLQPYLSFHYHTHAVTFSHRSCVVQPQSGLLTTEQVGVNCLAQGDDLSCGTYCILIHTLPHTPLLKCNSLPQSKAAPQCESQTP